MLSGRGEWESGSALTGYPAEWALPSAADRDALIALMRPAPTGSSATPSATSSS
jgi:hypothetical protein